MKTSNELRVAINLLLAQAEPHLAPIEIEKVALQAWRDRKIRRMKASEGCTRPGFAGRVVFNRHTHTVHY